MPYIEHRLKELIDRGSNPRSAGELNYALTKVILRYWQYSNRRYQDINDIIGALEGAKAEFQRRVVAPYEDKKIAENGDIY